MRTFQRHDRKPCCCWRFLLLFLLIHANIYLSIGQKYQLNIVSGAAEKGAVCLDGSSPGYYFSPGFGSGLNKWIVYIEGGAWCNSDGDCANRANSFLGSTKIFGPPSSAAPTTGILSDNPGVNPDFYNWNVAWVRYCDGASFLGDRDEPVVSQGQTIYYRGARVWDAIMEDLKGKGMAVAEEALLAGCSAGGLTTIHRCSSFRDVLPPQTLVKCFADAGFFLDIPDLRGGQNSANYYHGVAVTHNVMGNLDSVCTSSRAPDAQWECIFAHNVLPYVRAPIYILQSTLDSWQLQTLVGPKWMDPTGEWNSCVNNMMTCNSTLLSAIRGYQRKMVEDIGSGSAEERGEFVISCLAHCMSADNNRWSGHGGKFTIRGKTMQQSFGDWFYGRSLEDVLLVDEPSSVNPTC
ncbi:hypothetical protein R1sor_007295 [Riccia sorocarpa]|uniref:Pectin acetylesterase n=1 Tax=Riccia sorocarpa TaxID=122646 RepID=A0ABD3HTG9_9MARC